MTYLTVEVEIENGAIKATEPEKVPKSGRGLLTIIDDSMSAAPKDARQVDLPLIQGDGQRIINPTKQDLDASLWD